MKGIQAYQQSSVQTSPSKLLLMLFDGFIRFCKQGQLMMKENRLDQANHWIVKAQNILVELMTTLNRKVAPELCENLYALYDFMYRHLVEANIKKDPSMIDDVIKLGMELRDTFQQASIQVAKEKSNK
jgi:flagellar protein FliS